MKADVEPGKLPCVFPSVAVLLHVDKQPVYVLFPRVRKCIMGKTDRLKTGSFVYMLRYPPRVRALS